MTRVRIFVRYGGVWNDKQTEYQGGLLKGIVVCKEITYQDLLDELYALTEADPKESDMKIKCIYEIKARNQTPPFEISNDRDLNFYLMGEDTSEVPLYISFEPRSRDLTEVESQSQNNSMMSHKEDISRERNANVDCEAPVEPECDHVPKVDRKRKLKVNYESDSVGQKKYMKKNVWSEGSSTNDEFDVGQIFFGKRDLSMKLSVMAMKRNFEFRVKKSTKELIYIVCVDENCKWRIRALKLGGSDIFRISKYVNVHSCSLDLMNRHHRQAKAWVVGELIKSKFNGVRCQYKPREIIEDMRQDYGINMSYEKAWRARENVYMQVKGSSEESYNLLHRYGEALKLANPGTFYEIQLEDGSFFKYLFMALGPCIRGFLNCIRPVIVIDGTVLKNKYRGTLIVATCLDGNNQIYPIAFGIVDKETDDSIKWFFEKLKGAIGEVKDLIFVSDRNNSIAKSIAIVFPTAFHGLCIHHLKQNLSAKFNNETIDYLFVNAAKAYRESQFRELWERISAFDNGVGMYLEEVGLSRWTRIYCPGRRYNMMTTNIAESMNALLKEARELHVVSVIEHVRALLQRWFSERRDEASKVTSTLTKWAEEIVHKNQDQSTTMKMLFFQLVLLRSGRCHQTMWK
ncbi:uncharacterized protein LOC111022579 isoform X2 [Momordica charantia]|uniref:Uncharacterized protein LOC111022579 isoform X2 n=1 Tax=Momordica charantia TaxID=3673 RepID=A0A6J1DPC2_MOMCH|nr:uncharacterized protein LOC111022579 isoform X2 [Momordica charantia]